MCGYLPWNDLQLRLLEGRQAWTIRSPHLVDELDLICHTWYLMYLHDDSYVSYVQTQGGSIHLQADLAEL